MEWVRNSLVTRCLALLALGLLSLMPAHHAQGGEANQAFSILCAEPGAETNPALGRELAELLGGKSQPAPDGPDSCKACHALCAGALAAPAILALSWPAPEAMPLVSHSGSLNGQPCGPPLGARGPPHLI